MSEVGLDLVRGSMAPCWKLMAESCGGSAWERDGVIAAVIPAAPDRSVFNSAFYEDGERLLGCLEEVAGVYAEAGVNAWTVWVPEADTNTAAGLEAAGHELDANPRAMAMRTEELREPPPREEVEIEERLDMGELARLNEIAYGYPPGDFDALADSALPGFHLYFARLGQDLAACAGIWDHDSDGVLSWVATAPEARGLGVSARLCAHAIAEAARRGIETTSLQATRLGRPIYERLGYRDFGALQMWERRRQHT